MSSHIRSYLYPFTIFLNILPTIPAVVKPIIEKKIINTKEGAKEVYDFGSIGWTWDDYTLDEIKNRENIYIITPDKLIEKDSLNLDY